VFATRQTRIACPWVAPRQQKEAPHNRGSHSGTGYDPSARFLRLGCHLAFQASSSSARAHNVRPLMNPGRPLSRFPFLTIKNHAQVNQ